MPVYVKCLANSKGSVIIIISSCLPYLVLGMLTKKKKMSQENPAVTIPIQEQRNTASYSRF